MKTMTIKIAAILAGVMAAGADGRGGEIPKRPEEIQFKELSFAAPEATGYRHELSNGVPVYMAVSKEFPLVNIVFTFKGGSYLEGAGKMGLADITGEMIRRGGTEKMKAEDLDERLDFLAANCGAGMGATTSTASLNALKSNLDEAFRLFMEMVRTPGFQADRLEVVKDEMVEGMKQRNDDAGPILNREWKALLYGADHFEAAEPTKASVEGITVEDLRGMHGRVFNPANLYIAVSGDFDEQEMLSKLEEAVSGWEKRERNADPPAPRAEVKPGLYHVEKDIPQGKVYIGLRGIKRDDPDFFAMLVMNQILGGGGFTSRVTNRVRSDEGLAYSAGTANQAGTWYPGEFRASFQSKNRTCALAAKIVLEEVKRMQDTAVTEKELETAKASFIETFPRTFESKPGMLNVFVNDELTGRAKDYWQTYRAKVQGVSAADVQKAAQKYLKAEAMAIMVVGKWSEIGPGDLEGRASMSEFFSGNAVEIPLKDPLTLEADGQ